MPFALSVRCEPVRGEGILDQCRRLHLVFEDAAGLVSAALLFYRGWEAGTSHFRRFCTMMRVVAYDDSFTFSKKVALPAVCIAINCVFSCIFININA